MPSSERVTCESIIQQTSPVSRNQKHFMYFAEYWAGRNIQTALGISLTTHFSSKLLANMHKTWSERPKFLGGCFRFAEFSATCFIKTEHNFIRQSNLQYSSSSLFYFNDKNQAYCINNIFLFLKANSAFCKYFKFLEYLHLYKC